MKQTPLQKAISEIETRIKYLKEQEFIAIAELDNIVASLPLRDMKWKLINELAARRGELEMYSLKPLQSLLPYERECVINAVKYGRDGHLSAQDYFDQTFNQNNIT